MSKTHMQFTPPVLALLESLRAEFKNSGFDNAKDWARQKIQDTNYMAMLGGIKLGEAFDIHNAVAQIRYEIDKE